VISALGVDAGNLSDGCSGRNGVGQRAYADMTGLHGTNLTNSQDCLAGRLFAGDHHLRQLDRW
jgi:hypothetical protein